MHFNLIVQYPKPNFEPYICNWPQCVLRTFSAYTDPGSALAWLFSDKKKNENRICINVIFCIFSSGKWFKIICFLIFFLFQFVTKVVDPDLNWISDITWLTSWSGSTKAKLAPKESRRGFRTRVRSHQNPWSGSLPVQRLRISNMQTLVGIIIKISPMEALEGLEQGHLPPELLKLFTLMALD